MTAERHARVKEIFLKATALDPDERAVFLDDACRGENQLRDNVETLLQHHRSETIVARREQRGEVVEEMATLKPAGKTVLSARIAAGSLAAGLLGNARRRAVIISLGVGFLVLVSVWTHYKVKRSMRGVMGKHLQALLTANVHALEKWIERREEAAEAWTNDDQVRDYVRELVEIGRGGPSAAERLRASPAQNGLLGELQPYLGQEGDAAILLAEETGLILSCNFETAVGAQLDAAASPVLEGVFQGETKFARPRPKDPWLSSSRDSSDRPATWIHAPVRDEAGAIIASLGFAKFADDRRAEIIPVPHTGKTDETYAFDENGLLLSESRFDLQLREIGLLPDRPDAESALTIELRDPGGDLTRGHKPLRESGRRPLTKLASLAIASRNSADSGQQEGVVLDDYRAYRGVMVIGAWKWLQQYDFGVAAEVDVREADAPLRHPESVIAVLLVLLAATCAVALFSSLSVVWLRKEVGEVLKLGQYLLVDLIGEGGMGKVYLARHALLKRPTAVKMIKREIASRKTLARFEREVQLASMLTHPNTIEIYDYGQTPDGIFYYAMEYLSGLNLAELVSREGAIPPGRIAHILRQVCGSLKEAHEMGLIHRDIKPQNIMLCQRGGQCDVVKVLDFGLVKHVENPAQSTITDPNVTIGTPLYMAPERLTAPESVDARSDIYSLGAVAYSLATGNNILEFANPIDLFDKILHAMPTPPSQRSDQQIPPDLETLIMRCLEKDPERRPQNSPEVLESLCAMSELGRWDARDAEAWWKAFHERSVAMKGAPIARGTTGRPDSS